MYDGTDLADLRQFVYTWHRAERMFHDAEIEQARNDLYDAAERFLRHLSQHAFEVDHIRPGWRQIYPEHDLDRAEHGDFAVEAAEEAEKLGTRVWEAQQSVVAIARRNLGI